jgi:flagellar FliL protein
MSDDAPNADAPVAKKKGGMMMKLIIGLVVVLGLGGGAAWWFMRGGEAQAAGKEEPALEERGLLAFEPFLVNLADTGGNRFLKATVQLVLESAEEAKLMEESPVVIGHLRSAILELLTQQSAPELVTPEGKEALKKAIKEHTSALLKHQKVLDVLFSEFVVQF